MRLRRTVKGEVIESRKGIAVRAGNYVSYATDFVWESLWHFSLCKPSTTLLHTLPTARHLVALSGLVARNTSSVTTAPFTPTTSPSSAPTAKECAAAATTSTSTSALKALLSVATRPRCPRRLPSTTSGYLFALFCRQEYLKRHYCFLHPHDKTFECTDYQKPRRQSQPLNRYRRTHVNLVRRNTTKISVKAAQYNFSVPESRPSTPLTRIPVMRSPSIFLSYSSAL
jgi:hypothetical protein